MQKLSDKMEKDGARRAKESEEVVKDIKSSFIVPGIIGDGLPYPDFKKFVMEVHEHKESSFEDVSKLLDMRIKDLQKKTTKSADEQKKDLMVHLKNHESEINYLGKKIGDLSDKLDELIA